MIVNYEWQYEAWVNLFITMGSELLIKVQRLSSDGNFFE
jgi:hypothetical protein